MIQISNKVFYIGTNDRKKHLFENNWPLPNGVAYNSYIIADEHPALVDTLEYGSDPDYLSNIDTALGGRELEYLVVNHMEPDHSSMIGEILRRYPRVKVVANCKTFKILESYYPLPAENVYEIKEGDILELGYHKLTFVMVPWVHWPETMVTYDTVDQILFSCDAAALLFQHRGQVERHGAEGLQEAGGCACQDYLPLSRPYMAQGPGQGAGSLRQVEQV